MLHATQASAQTYPERVLTYVVPYPAGGAADVFARQLAQKLGERLGRPVVVENRAGANGNIGSDHVAKGAADGYTLLLGSASARSLPLLTSGTIAGRLLNIIGIWPPSTSFNAGGPPL